MASLMPQGKQAYTDSAGNPLAGGKLYTYAAGTDTPLATYSDEAGATPNTNPVVLDARGEATVFWSAAPYKIVLKDSADVTLWTQDDVYVRGRVTVTGGSTPRTLEDHLATLPDAKITATGSTTARSLQDRAADTINVKDYGCTGDGSTDDGPSIQAALDDAAANSKGVFFPAGTYRTAQALTLSHAIGIVIYGENSRNTKITCDLAAGATGLTMHNCGWVTWRDIAWEGSDSNALLSLWDVEVDSTHGSDQLSTSMRVENVRLLGGDAYAEYGVRYVLASGSAAVQNDLSAWTKVIFQKFRRAAFYTDHANSKQHAFRDCQISYMGRGTPGAADGWDDYAADEGYGLWIHNGSFKWHDGYVGVVKGSAFYADTLSTEGAAVYGVSIESCARIFEFTGTSSEPAPVRLEGIRYSAAHLTTAGSRAELDSLAVKVGNAVVMTIRGNRFGSSGQASHPKISLTNANPSYVEIVGNEWESTGADAVADMIAYPAATEAEVHGNTYKTAAGARTLLQERRLEGVKAIEWTASAGNRGNNLRGTVTVTGAATSGEVLFATLGGNEPDTSYYVAISGAHTIVNGGGAIPTGAYRVVKVTKGTTKVIIDVEAAPGADNSVSFDWIMVR